MGFFILIFPSPLIALNWANESHKGHGAPKPQDSAANWQSGSAFGHSRATDWKALRRQTLFIYSCVRDGENRDKE